MTAHTDSERMRWESISVSDRGLIRPNNEDSALENLETGLFAVADGMGGHAAGEVASRMAVEALRAADDAGLDGDGDGVEGLLLAFSTANGEIRRRSHAEPDKRGMGTTLTVLRFESREEGTGAIVHIGDSRAYRLRDGRLEQLTKDHTWVQERVDAGVLTPEQARAHPYSSILTRVLGTDEPLAPDVVTVEARPGDLYLLCSDGLSGMVPDADLERILNESDDLGELADLLIQAAKAGGGFDNITAVLVRAVDG